MTNPTSVPSLDVEACVREAAEAIEGLFVPAHRSGCLWLNDHRMPCQCGSAERERAAVLRARRAAEALRHALALALPGMGKDSERLRQIREQCRVIYYGTPDMYPIEHAPGANKDSWEWMMLHLDAAAARAAQPEETSADERS